MNSEHIDRDTFNTDELQEAAIEGLISSVPDPYISYVDTVSYEIDKEDLSGEFQGIGAICANEGRRNGTNHQPN